MKHRDEVNVGALQGDVDFIVANYLIAINLVRRSNIEVPWAALALSIVSYVVSCERLAVVVLRLRGA